jgi:MerR family transcriptional regulator, light-induced transcriptional regulator
VEPDAVPRGLERADEPHLSVAAVARMLGIAPATLRTWDRRYGIGPSSHAPGRHRRYSPEDVARLETMRHALVRGVGPAEAARYAMAAANGRPAALVDAARARAGGTMLRLPGASRFARGLGRAALALDFPAARTVLIEAIAAIGVVSTWDDVARPVLAAVAQRWVATGAGVEVEHLLSQSVAAVFSAHTVAQAEEPDGRPVLLTGMPREQHTLPLLVLGAALGDRGVPVQPMGTDLPRDALVAAVRRTAPAAVVLWSQLPASADVALLEALPETRPRSRTFVAGPGWADVGLPAQVQRLTTLVGAVEALVAAAR